MGKAQKARHVKARCETPGNKAKCSSCTESAASFVMISKTMESSCVNHFALSALGFLHDADAQGRRFACPWLLHSAPLALVELDPIIKLTTTKSYDHLLCRALNLYNYFFNL